MLAFLIAFFLIVASVSLLERGRTDSDVFEVGGVVAIPYLLVVVALRVVEHVKADAWAVQLTVAAYYLLTFLLLWRVLLIPAQRSLSHTLSVFAIWSALVLMSDLPLGAR